MRIETGSPKNGEAYDNRLKSDDFAEFILKIGIERRSNERSATEHFQFIICIGIAFFYFPRGSVYSCLIKLKVNAVTWKLSAPTLVNF